VRARPWEGVNSLLSVCSPSTFVAHLVCRSLLPAHCKIYTYAYTLTHTPLQSYSHFLHTPLPNRVHTTPSLSLSLQIGRSIRTARPRASKEFLKQAIASDPRNPPRVDSGPICHTDIGHGIRRFQMITCVQSFTCAVLSFACSIVFRAHFSVLSVLFKLS
jgi:hypothetical protein